MITELVDEIYKQLESRLKNEDDNKSEVMPLNDIENEGLSRNEGDFIEREDVFNEIDARLLSDNKTVLLHGLPSVGKSSCAIEFILKKKKDCKIQNYFYFPSDQDYKINNSISSFCKQLNLTNETDTIEAKIKAFTNYLAKTNDEIILFFDNVDDFEALNKIIDYKSINKPTILT